MTMMRKIVRAQMMPLGADEVRIIMSTASLARDGHILEPQGCILENYRRNPIQLWQHDPDHPVGTNEDIKVSRENITALCRFAPLGISKKADEIRGLVKSGVIGAVSVSFDGIESTPIDPKKPRAGQRFTKWELMECSFVSVPADVGAVVVARAIRAGKAISTENAKLLQAAHDHALSATKEAENARALLNQLLDAAGDDGRSADFQYRQWRKRLARKREINNSLSADFLRRQARKQEFNGSDTGRSLTKEFRQRQARKWAVNAPDISEAAPPLTQSRAQRMARARELATPRF